MPEKTVKARWVAPFRGELPDKTELIPGETVVDLPKHEAEASDNWQVVSSKGKASKGSSSKGKASKGSDS